MATRPQTTTTSTLPSTKKWKIIYPCYLSSKRSANEGRQVPKEYCVENPTLQGMFEVLKTFGLPFEIELNKTHPRDFGVPGRIKVRIYSDDHKPLNPEIKTKQDLLRKIGKALPNAGSSAAGDQGKKNKKTKKP
eukprot:Phypoly_transcript_09998.p1 GENE.Phypoly_transcript_09998~~Phypoly_transcript_09998.p1  ORF type:complete len:134 (+),score=20.29 Phypoly_transcript_09998:926-1327(+)